MVAAKEGIRSGAAGREGDDTLVGAAPEVEFGVTQGFYEGAVHQNVKMGQDGGEAGVGGYFLVGEAGVAPDGLVGFDLDAAGEGGEGFNLIQGVTAGEGYIGELIGGDNVKQFIDRHLSAADEVPRLGVVAAGAMMGAACAVDGSAETGAVSHSFFQYVQNSYLHQTASPFARAASRFFSSSAGRTSSQDFMASYASYEP